MKVITNSLTASGALIGLLLAIVFAAKAQAYPNAPDYVTIRSIAYAGTGCPAGSVAENVAFDRQAFTLLFDSYVAEADGPYGSLRDRRKNCQINLDLDFPSGWSFTILDVDYRGFAMLDAGVQGIEKSSYYFQGDMQTASLQTVLRGPVTTDYQLRDSLALSAAVWSPCGAQRSLNINTQVQVNPLNRYGRGLMTIDSIDGQLTHIYRLQWRRCY